MLYVNPFILLRQSPDVMKDGIKREVLHIISAHLMRVKATEPRLSQNSRSHGHGYGGKRFIFEHVDRDAVTVANVNERFGFYFVLKTVFRTI